MSLAIDLSHAGHQPHRSSFTSGIATYEGGRHDWAPCVRRPTSSLSRPKSDISHPQPEASSSYTSSPSANHVEFLTSTYRYEYVSTLYSHTGTDTSQLCTLICCMI